MHTSLPTSTPLSDVVDLDPNRTSIAVSSSSASGTALSKLFGLGLGENMDILQLESSREEALILINNTCNANVMRREAGQDDMKCGEYSR